MVEWSDSGLVIGNRSHGETHSIATLFTATHGRADALVHGGQGRTKGPLLQQGNKVFATKRGRGEDSLGHFELELDQPYAATAMAQRDAALALSAACDLLHAVLPEGESYPPLFAATEALFANMVDPDILAILFVKWELGLLAALGFGLSLEACAATGRRLEDGVDLVFVSPKSGSAVSYEAGMPYKDRMLPLPPFLIDRGEPTLPDVAAAMRLTGYFLAERLLAPAGKELPDARDRFVSRIERRGGAAW